MTRIRRTRPRLCQAHSAPEAWRRLLGPSTRRRIAITKWSFILLRKYTGVFKGHSGERNNAKRCESRAAPGASATMRSVATRVARRAERAAGATMRSVADRAPQAQQCEALRIARRAERAAGATMRSVANRAPRPARAQQCEALRIDKEK
jgi:hypothetical protein